MLVALAAIALAGCNSGPDPVLASRDARKACREAQDLADQVAALRDSLNQEPSMPDELQRGVDETCETAAAMVPANPTPEQRAQIAADIEAEAIVEAALN